LALERVPDGSILPESGVAADGAAYAAGAFFGALIIPLAIAFALRLVYVKLIRRDGRPVWSPWLVFVAGVIALLAQAGRLSQES
jgi:formate hydrogenlyase subunit 3/multisubunit Na+/H+ antiporter MnhD subunit